MWIRACNSGGGQEETQASQPSSVGRFQINMKFCLKKQRAV